MRIAFALIFGVLFAWIAFSRPEEAEDPEGKGPRYRPYLNGWLMPGYMTTLLVGCYWPSPSCAGISGREAALCCGSRQTTST